MKMGLIPYKSSKGELSKTFLSEKCKLFEQFKMFDKGSIITFSS
jgi:hypothetical protein